MPELKPREISEIRHPEAEGYKDIKANSGITPHESRKFWDDELSDSSIEKANSDTQHKDPIDQHQIDSSQNYDESIEDSTEGGSYRDVKKNSDSNTHEVHHMPSDSSSPLDRMDGPAIKMEKEDHRKTASCGASIEAREYQAEQRRLIENGDFRGALQMDIDDIREKFGNKYDKAIEQMLVYVDKLEAEGMI